MGKGLKIGLISAIAVLLIGGGVLGAAKMRFINIPGLTPKPVAKKGAAKTEKPVDSAPKPAPKPQKKVAKGTTEPPKIDPQKGIQQIADLWSEMDTESLVKIARNWDNARLAPVLLAMDSGKATALLARIDPEPQPTDTKAPIPGKRASELCKLMQELASKVPLVQDSKK